MAFLLEDEDTPVVWRGPIKLGAINQFIGDVEWGELDYLVIDFPPGTSDEPLTVAQSLPDIDGMVIVTTPQDVALLDSRKSITFSESLKVPVLGVVENMTTNTTVVLLLLLLYIIIIILFDSPLCSSLSCSTT